MSGDVDVIEVVAPGSVQVVEVAVPGAVQVIDVVIQGAQGPKGDMPAHQWSDTQVQFENPDGSWGAFVDLVGPQGPQGDTGEKGDEPAHEWSGTELRFENPDGSWGGFVDLKGDPPAHQWDATSLRFQNPGGDWGAYVDLKGDTGATGEKGDKPAHQWTDTQLQFENPDGSWGEYTDLKGDKGDTGEKGDPPAHQWDGTSLQFENPDGTWGLLTDLEGPQGPQGEKGDTGDPFTIDATGPESDRSLYDDELEGFAFLATDTGLCYVKNSDTSGDWSDGVQFAGEGVPAGGLTGQYLRKATDSDYDTEWADFGHTHVAADLPSDVVYTADLATVATSGDYNDLINTPTLFSGSYLDLTDVPTTFTPESHGDEAHSETYATETYVDNSVFSGNPSDLAQELAADGQVLTWNNTDGKWEPQTGYTDSDAVNAVNADADHGSTAQHDYFSGSYNDLTDVPTEFTPASHGDEAHSEDYYKRNQITVNTADPSGDPGYDKALWLKVSS